MSTPLPGFYPLIPTIVDTIVSNCIAVPFGEHKTCNTEELELLESLISIHSHIKKYEQDSSVLSHPTQYYVYQSMFKDLWCTLSGHFHRGFSKKPSEALLAQSKISIFDLLLGPEIIIYYQDETEQIDEEVFQEKILVLADHIRQKSTRETEAALVEALPEFLSRTMGISAESFDFLALCIYDGCYNGIIILQSDTTDFCECFRLSEKIAVGGLGHPTKGLWETFTLPEYFRDSSDV